LKQVQGVLIEKHNAKEQDKISLQEKFDEEKSQMEQGKEQFLVQQREVKEAVSRELHPVTVLEMKVEDQITQQVEKLAEYIQQLQQCIVDLELCTVPENPQDVRD
jgi:hypothetical protein